MKNVLQITAKDIPNFTAEVWFDLMEVIVLNNMKDALDAAKKDFPDRKVRIIQIMEE